MVVPHTFSDARDWAEQVGAEASGRGWQEEWLGKKVQTWFLEQLKEDKAKERAKIEAEERREYVKGYIEEEPATVKQLRESLKISPENWLVLQGGLDGTPPSRTTVITEFSRNPLVLGKVSALGMSPERYLEHMGILPLRINRDLLFAELKRGNIRPEQYKALEASLPQNKAEINIETYPDWNLDIFNFKNDPELAKKKAEDWLVMKALVAEMHHGAHTRGSGADKMPMKDYLKKHGKL